MEVLCYLRDTAPERKMDVSAALRLLAAHKETIAAERATRANVSAAEEDDPRARIALVAANLGEARSVMVEGESGVMACAPPHCRPIYEPSLRRVRWPNGAEATLFSAAEPESLRGPQHSHAWSGRPRRKFS